MASPCRIVTDDVDLAHAGRALVHELEQRWSRFIADSEVSRVNRAGGAMCVVSEPTRELFERAEFARVATGGRFNGFVLDRLVAIERSAEQPGMASWPPGGPVLDGPITLPGHSGAVQLPRGVRFDPGGIGKGLAADMVVRDLEALGATTAQVELGGDVRLMGECWTGGPWNVVVVDARDRTHRLGEVSITSGAAATSSVLSRTFDVAGRRLHHLIDPFTGTSCETDLLAVTTTSSELWWAEVMAKSVLIAGSVEGRRLLDELGMAAVMLHVDGTVSRIGMTEGCE
jgi:thiamine biosynthesis lipoprotein